MSRVSNFITHSVREGFTLIEVMIVVGLIMMFTTIGLEIDRQTKSQIEFFRDQARVVHAIYQAREYTMTARGGECGYGIRVLNNQLDIVKSSRDEVGMCPDGVGVVSIDESITISSTLQGNFTLVFMAPFGEQFLEGGSSCFVITDSSGSYSSVIKINEWGTPYIDKAVSACN